MAGGKILLVASSNSKLGDTGEETGAWLEEIATPYFVFKKAGYEVVIASPKGGNVPLDKKSLSEGFLTEDCKVFQADGAASALLENSVALSSVVPEEYMAVFVAGGHGIVYDGPPDAVLKSILENLYAADKVVAAVCHGPCGLVSALRPDGKSILFDKKVTGFSNTEEEAVGLTKVVPFLLEDKLKSLGGLYEKGADWTPYAVTDGKIVTGQNPQSSEKTAEAVLAVLA